MYMQRPLPPRPALEQRRAAAAAAAEEVRAAAAAAATEAFEAAEAEAEAEAVAEAAAGRPLLLVCGPGAVPGAAPAGPASSRLLHVEVRFGLLLG